MFKDTSKLKFIIQNDLSFELKERTLYVYDQNGGMIGKRYVPVNVGDNASAEEIYEKANLRGIDIDMEIEYLLKEAIVERRWYDVWITDTLIMFYSQSAKKWVSEPRVGMFGKLASQLTGDKYEPFVLGKDTV